LDYVNFGTLRDLRNLGCPQELAKKLSRWNMSDFTEPVYHVSPDKINPLIADFLRANPSQRPGVKSFLTRLNLLRKVKLRTVFLRDIYGPTIIDAVEKTGIGLEIGGDDWEEFLSLIRGLVSKLNQSLGDKSVFLLTGTRTNIKRALTDDDYFWSLSNSRTWDLSLEEFSFRLYGIIYELGLKKELPMGPQQIQQDLVNHWTETNREFPPFYWALPSSIITFNYP